MFTDQVEQSRNVRWAFLHCALAATATVKRLRGPEGLLHPTMSEHFRFHRNWYCLQWYKEYYLAIKNGWFKGHCTSGIRYV